MMCNFSRYNYVGLLSHLLTMLSIHIQDTSGECNDPYKGILVVVHTNMAYGAANHPPY